MKLAPNWRTILRSAWSIRLIVLAGVFSGAELALPLLDQVIEIPRGFFAAATGLVTAAAFVSRLVAQKGITDE